MLQTTSRTGRGLRPGPWALGVHPSEPSSRGDRPPARPRAQMSNENLKKSAVAPARAAQEILFTIAICYSAMIKFVILFIGCV